MQGGEKFEPLTHMCPAEAEQGDLRMLVSAQTANKCPFYGLFSARFFVAPKALYVGDFVV